MKKNIDAEPCREYTHTGVRGYVMKYKTLFTALLLMVAATGGFAQGTDAEQRALICDDLLQELSKPLPPPKPSTVESANFLEPLYNLEETKLTLLAVFGISFTVMLRILSQMQMKARERRQNTHASTLHYRSRKVNDQTCRKRRKGMENRSSRSSLRRSVRCALSSLEQFQVSTMHSRRPRYTRSYRRFSPSPSY